MVRDFLKLGVDPNQLNPEGKTALQIAKADRPDENLQRLLLEYGAVDSAFVPAGNY